jgi:hypothetical protein
MLTYIRRLAAGSSSSMPSEIYSPDWAAGQRLRLRTDYRAGAGRITLMRDLPVPGRHTVSAPGMRLSYPPHRDAVAVRRPVHPQSNMRYGRGR